MDLTRTEAKNTVQHFYRMEIMPGLFGDWSLVRNFRFRNDARLRIGGTQRSLSARWRVSITPGVQRSTS